MVVQGQGALLKKTVAWSKVDSRDTHVIHGGRDSSFSPKSRVHGLLKKSILELCHIFQ